MPRTRLSRLLTSLVAVAGLLTIGVTGASTAQAATATVHGYLTDKSTGAPIVGAYLQLEDITTGVYVRTATTAADGSFTLDVVPRTENPWGSIGDRFSVLYNYCLEASCSDYPEEWLGGVHRQDDAQTFTLAAGASHDASYQLARGATVHGTVTLADGHTATSGWVYAEVARAGGGTDSINPGVPVAADGAYSIRGLPTSGTVTLSYSRPWDDADSRCYAYMQTGLGTLASGSTTTKDLAEKYQPSIVARVVDQAGKPVDYLGAIPLTKRGSGGFEAPQAGPFGTNGAGVYKQCATVGTQMKIAFVDFLGADMAPVKRTVPVRSTWVGTGGARGSSQADAPVIPVTSTNVIDLGTIVLGPQPTVKVSGTAKVGSTLRASTPGWAPAGVAASYRWTRDSTPIAGAIKASYTLVAADRGKRIAVVVTGAIPGAQGSAAVTTSVVKKGKLTTKAPKVKGTKKVGKKLKAKPGSWTKGTKLSYQWFRQGPGKSKKWKKIKGAKKTTYKLRTADRKARLRVKVTGKKSGYTAASRVSARTAKVR